MNPSRRKFIKDIIKTGSKLIVAPVFLQGLAGCVYTDPREQSPKEFTIENFDKWYRANKLYNGINPNLKFPHSAGNYPTFEKTSFSPIGATPGIDYDVPSGEVMVAVAPGRILKIDEIDTAKTGRAGGGFVVIGLPIDGYIVSAQ